MAVHTRYRHITPYILALLILALSAGLLARPVSAADQGAQPDPNEIWVEIPAESESYPVTIDVRNTGTTDWGSADLIAFNYQYETGDSSLGGNRIASKYHCDNNGWESTSRMPYLSSTTSPGGTGRFDFEFCNPTGAPPVTTDTWDTEHFALARDGEWILDSSGNRIKITVHLRVTHQAERPDPSSLTVMIPTDTNRSEPVSINVTNDGPTWTNTVPVALNYQYESGDSGSAGNTASQFYCADWEANHRPDVMDSSALQKGQTTTFSFSFCNPENAALGTYTEHFAMAAGPVWMTRSTGRRSVVEVTIMVVDPPKDYQGEQPEPNEIWVDIPEMAQSKPMTIEVTNTGTKPWEAADQVAFNYQYEAGDSGTNNNTASNFYCENWEQEGTANARIDYVSNATVEPGETGELLLWFCNPSGEEPTNEDSYPYTEHYTLARGTEWVSDENDNRVKLTVHLRVTEQASDLHTGPPKPQIIYAYIPEGSTSKVVTATATNDSKDDWTADTLVALNYQYEANDIGSAPDPSTGLYGASRFHCADWENNHRPALMQETTVGSGQRATFAFQFCDNEPYDGLPLISIDGIYSEHYALAAGPIWMLDETGERQVIQAQIMRLPADSMVFEWIGQDFPETEGEPVPVPQFGTYEDVKVWFRSVGGQDPAPERLQMCLRKDLEAGAYPVDDSLLRHSNWVTYTEALQKQTDANGDVIDQVEGHDVRWCIPGTPQVTASANGNIYEFSVDFGSTQVVSDAITENCETNPGDGFCREDFGIVYERDDGTYEWVTGTPATGRGTPISNDVFDWDANVWWKLVIEEAPPSSLEIISPEDSTITSTVRPLLDWQLNAPEGEPPPEKYQLLLTWEQSDNPTPVEIDVNVANTEYISPTDLRDGYYTWSVSAYRNGEAAETDTASFYVDTMPPTSTIQISDPRNYATTCASRPTFVWSTSDNQDPLKDGYASGIARYEIQIDDEPIQVVDAADTQYTPADDLSDGIHSWKLRAIDNAGNISDWTETYQLEIDSTVVEAPQPVYPAGQTLCDSTVGFHWNPSSCGVSYEFRLDDGTAVPLIDTLAYTTTVSDGEHTWAIRAINALGATSEWVTETVIVSVNPPAIPLLIDPADGATRASTRPLLNWEESPEAGTHYNVRLASTTESNIYESGSNSFYKPDTPLEPGQYTWDIQAFNQCNVDSDWSPTRAFTITGTARPWTLMYYFSGDNNQDVATLRAINRLEAVADNPDVNIVVLWDRQGEGNTNLYHLLHDTDMTAINSLPVPLTAIPWNATGELNMGDPQTLVEFVTWAKDEYEADSYMLSVFDHGGGWSPHLPSDYIANDRWGLGGAGLAWDRTSQDYLSTHEMNMALNTLTGGVDKIDVLYYDASLMAMLESAYEVRDFAAYFVASQNVIFNTFPYDGYIPAITATTSPEALARAMVSAYASTIPDEGGTLTVFNLAEAAVLAEAVDDLAGAILNDSIMLSAVIDEIGEVYTTTQKFDYDGDEHIHQHDAYIDLHHFASPLGSSSLFGDSVKTTARRVTDLLDAGGFVLTTTYKSGVGAGGYGLDNANGVSIYAPFGEELYVGSGCSVTDVCAPSPGPDCIKVRDYYADTAAEPLAFTSDTRWDEFIDTMIQEHYCEGNNLASINTSEPRNTIESLPAQRPVRLLTSPRTGNREVGTSSVQEIFLPLVQR